MILRIIIICVLFFPTTSAFSEIPENEYYPIQKSISLDKEEYRIGDPITIAFKLTNISHNDVVVSLFNEESWAANCFFNTKDDYKKNFYKRKVYLGYYNETERENILNAKVITLEPGESYQYEFESRLFCEYCRSCVDCEIDKEMKGELFWIQGSQDIYWKYPQGNRFIERAKPSNKITITIKPSFSQEQYEKAYQQVKDIRDYEKLIEDVGHPETPLFDKSAMLDIISGYFNMSICFDLCEQIMSNSQELSKHVMNVFTSHDNALLRLKAAKAWINLQKNDTTQNGYETMISQIVKGLIDDDLFVRKHAWDDKDCLRYHLSEISTVVIDKIYEEFNNNHITEKKELLVHYLIILLQSDLMHQRMTKQSKLKISDILIWALSTKDNSFCQYILSSDLSKWLITSDAIPIVKT